MIQTIHMFCMLILAGIGFFCSAKLSDEHPLWVRLIVLSPALMALATLAAIAQDAYVAYEPDIGVALSVMLIYALVASRFTDRPWLDIRKSSPAPNPCAAVQAQLTKE